VPYIGGTLSTEKLPKTRRRKKGEAQTSNQKTQTAKTSLPRPDSRKGPGRKTLSAPPKTAGLLLQVAEQPP